MPRDARRLTTPISPSTSQPAPPGVALQYSRRPLSSLVPAEPLSLLPALRWLDGRVFAATLP